MAFRTERRASTFFVRITGHLQTRGLARRRLNIRKTRVKKRKKKNSASFAYGRNGRAPIVSKAEKPILLPQCPQGALSDRIEAREEVGTPSRRYKVHVQVLPRNRPLGVPLRHPLLPDGETYARTLFVVGVVVDADCGYLP